EPQAHPGRGLEGTRRPPGPRSPTRGAPAGRAVPGGRPRARGARSPGRVPALVGDRCRGGPGTRTAVASGQGAMGKGGGGFPQAGEGVSVRLGLVVTDKGRGRTPTPAVFNSDTVRDYLAAASSNLWLESVRLLADRFLVAVMTRAVTGRSNDPTRVQVWELASVLCSSPVFVSQWWTTKLAGRNLPSALVLFSSTVMLN